SSVTSGGDPLSAWGDRGSPDPIINLPFNQPDKNESDLLQKTAPGRAPAPPLGAEKAPELTAAETAQKWSLCVEELGAQFKTMAEGLKGRESFLTGRPKNGKADLSGIGG